MRVPEGSTILVSGGAGYIGSHASYALRQAGYLPVVMDNLVTGNPWAMAFGESEIGDIGDGDFVRAVCKKYRPVAAMHFAAFIEVGESVKNPTKYFTNNFDKASRFFKTLAECDVKKIVFSSTAAVYGDVDGKAPITESFPAQPINPYGQSKLDAETYLRSLDGDGINSITLRYFNVAGAAEAEANIGEAHAPETHLIPRLLLPLLGTPENLLRKLDLHKGFTIYGNDYPTPDGTAIRDYIHVLDLVDAHLKALKALLNGGKTDIFNLGSGQGFSVLEIVNEVRNILNNQNLQPRVAPRRAGDPTTLIASNDKAASLLGWRPTRSLSHIIKDAAAWHQSPRYRDALAAK